MEKSSFYIDKDFDEPNVFKNILKGVKIPLLLVGLDGRIKFFTSYYKKILGDLDLHVGMNFQKYIHPEDKNILVNLYEKGIKEGKSYLSENIEFRIKRNDGKYIWISTHTESYIDDHGDIRGFVSVLNDITEKKTLQRKYTQLKEELKMIQMKKNTSNFIDLNLVDIDNMLEGICALFNIAFDPNEILFWIGIENLSKLFTTFVQMLLESAGCGELQQKIKKLDLDFKVTNDGQGYLELRKS